MKLLFLCIAICIAGQLSGQALTADAGADRTWCMSSVVQPVDTPQFGGVSIASGGVPPYYISWYIRFGQYITLDLDSVHGLHPRITKALNTDSAYAVLTVQDDMGSVAKDSAKIFFPRRVCALGTTTDYKFPLDTFTLGQWQCEDQFPPYHDIIWTPGNTLVDSTVLNARSFTPISQVYHLTYTDRVGCRFRAGIDPVVVVAAGVSGIKPGSGIPNVFVDAGGKLHIDSGLTGRSIFVLFDPLGKEIATRELNDRETVIEDLPTNLAGIYLYKIIANNGLVFSGKLFR